MPLLSLPRAVEASHEIPSLLHETPGLRPEQLPKAPEALREDGGLPVADSDAAPYTCHLASRVASGPGKWIEKAAAVVDLASFKSAHKYSHVYASCS